MAVSHRDQSHARYPRAALQTTTPRTSNGCVCTRQYTCPRMRKGSASAPCSGCSQPLSSQLTVVKPHGSNCAGINSQPQRHTYSCRMPATCEWCPCVPPWLSASPRERTTWRRQKELKRRHVCGCVWMCEWRQPPLTSQCHCTTSSITSYCTSSRYRRGWCPGVHHRKQRIAAVTPCTVVTVETLSRVLRAAGASTGRLTGWNRHRRYSFPEEIRLDVGTSHMHVHAC